MKRKINNDEEYIRQIKRKQRRMELGYDGWQKRPDGSFFKRTPKGIQNYYTTRQLIEMVIKRMDMFEEMGRGRICYINNKWQLQIRGKHLRRLLKAKPNWKQVGRMIVEETK